MRKKSKLKIAFMGGSQAGMIGALTALAHGAEIPIAVSYSDELTAMLKSLGIAVCRSVKETRFIKELKKTDMLLSVHGREVVKPEIFNLPRFKAVNVHPYLYKYKGANPVDRAFKDGEFHASVGAHMMTEEVDGGVVLTEEFRDVDGASTVSEIYNSIYPLYIQVVSKTLDIFSKKRNKYGKKIA